MQMNLKGSKYLIALFIPVFTMIGFVRGGFYILFPLLFAFVLVPLFELVLKTEESNLKREEALIQSENKGYDFILYLLFPIQLFALYLFLSHMALDKLPVWERILMISAMGLNCGIIGINVGHELGHRSTKFEINLARLFLLTSLYMHFNIEHNRGHHKKVGTLEDPASARYGENLYAFLVRSIVQSYFSAWNIENVRLKKSGIRILSFKNLMIRFQVIQLLFLLSIYFYFGGMALLCFVIAAFLGICLLEAVNYIEHYGIGRILQQNGAPEKVQHCHSWNSNHVLGRLMLFELSRHSDHHYKAIKKYHLLDHHDESPQMPTGYPGMIILALIPPLWFSLIHPILEKEKVRMPSIRLAKK